MRHENRISSFLKEKMTTLKYTKFASRLKWYYSELFACKTCKRASHFLFVLIKIDVKVFAKKPKCNFTVVQFFFLTAFQNIQ